MSNISQFLKFHNHSWEHNGISIEVQIEYWSKDYSIRMLSPVNTVLCSYHMMYAVPVIYGIIDGDESVKIEYEGNVCNLLYIAKNVCEDYLDNYYNKGVDIEEKYTQCNRVRPSST